MAAETIRIEAGTLGEEGLDRLVDVLRRGELLALPTETVYGLAARADEEPPLERLRELKGRVDKHPFTVHLPDRASVSRHAAPPLRPALRLMDRYWPGPLTVIVPTAPGGWVGLRLPARAVTREILRRADFPVVLSSANRTGETPAVDAGEVERLFAGSLTVIVDGGRCELAQSSTVVRIGPGAFDVLREGILTGEELRRTAGRRVLIVCTGNTCRSPMAQGLLRRALARRLGTSERLLERFGYRVASAGLVALGGAPPSTHAIEAMRAEGIDISGHRTHSLTAAMIRESDLVLAMSRAHLALVRELAPDSEHKARLIDPDGADTPDPFGGTLEDYGRCLETLRRGVQAAAEDL